MDDFGVFFAIGIVLLVLIGPWVLAWRANSRRRRERDEDQERWRDLTSRIYALEQTVGALQTPPAAPVAEQATPKPSARPVAVAYTPPLPAPSLVPPPPPPTAEP